MGQILIEERPRVGRPPSILTDHGYHKCTLCKEVKDVREFHRDRSKSDGYSFRCKECNKAYKKQYHAQYRETHGEDLREKERRRYARDRVKRTEQGRQSRVRHGSKWNAAERAKHAANPIPNMLGNAKSRARRKNLKFDLHADDFEIPAFCPVLGLPLLVTPGKTTDNSPSLDRIDNAKGYVRGNVVVVSFKANTIKNTATVDELRMVLKFYENLR